MANQLFNVFKGNIHSATVAMTSVTMHLSVPPGPSIADLDLISWEDDTPLTFRVGQFREKGDMRFEVTKNSDSDEDGELFTDEFEMLEYIQRIIGEWVR